LPQSPYLIAIASELAPRLAPISLLIERSDIDNASLAPLQAELARLRASEAEIREAARVAVEQAIADGQAAAVTLTHTRAALVQANTDLDRVSSSARHFLRQYIPRLWRLLVR